MTIAQHRPALQQRRFKHDSLVAVDLFSGFGGLTQGIAHAGFDVITAANHSEAEHRAHESCDLISEHPHLTVTHTVTISEWSKPVSSENTGGDS